MNRAQWVAGRAEQHSFQKEGSGVALHSRACMRILRMHEPCQRKGGREDRGREGGREREEYEERAPKLDFP